MNFDRLKIKLEELKEERIDCYRTQALLVSKLEKLKQKLDARDKEIATVLDSLQGKERQIIEKTNEAEYFKAQIDLLEAQNESASYQITGLQLLTSSLCDFFDISLVEEPENVAYHDLVSLIKQEQDRL
jgi:chromosome segregation ATPase